MTRAVEKNFEQRLFNFGDSLILRVTYDRSEISYSLLSAATRQANCSVNYREHLSCFAVNET
jgi:hypothetical protein